MPIENTMNGKFGFWSPFVMSLGVLALIGCKNADRPLAPAEDRLLKIGNAYVNAVNKNKTVPKSVADIKAFLEGSLDDVLISPGDGEKFVILWGIDYNQLPPGKDDPFTVAAYEKNGVDGKRYVLRFPRSVVLMTDEEFRKAIFPPGHQCPI